MKITIVKLDSYIKSYTFRDTQFMWWGFSSKKKPFKLLLNGKERLLKVLGVIKVPRFLRSKKEFTVIPKNPNNIISLRSLSNLGFIFSWLLIFNDAHFSSAKEKFHLHPCSAYWSQSPHCPFDLTLKAYLRQLPACPCISVGNMLS